MNYRFVFLFVLVLGLGWGCKRHVVNERLDVSYIDCGYQYKNPYTTEDLVYGNEFLDRKMRSYASDSTVEAYLVPMKGVNRVLFVTAGRKWTMDEKYRIVRELEEFLGQQRK